VTLDQEASLAEFGPGREAVSITTKRQILAPWEEAVGLFRELVSDGGSLLATIGPVSVYLPMELEPELRSLIGKKIALLRTDDPVKPYRIRQASG